MKLILPTVLMLLFLQSPASADEIDWHAVANSDVEGQGWKDGLLRTYDRLPAKAKETVPGIIWNFSRESAGISVRFITDATAIHIRYSLKSGNLSHGWGDFSNRMGSGFDMYAQVADPKSGKMVWRWVGGNKPTKQSATSCLATGLAPGKRMYLINFPIYNGVEKLEVGVPANAKFEMVAPRKDKPIVFYGTSIIQGAAASRPGLTIAARIGRKLDIPIINLGFCGCGRMDMPVVELLAELDPAIYVIDCLPNMGAAMVEKRTAPLVKRLREAHSDTPILLVEEHDSPSPSLFPGKAAGIKKKQDALRAEYDKLIQSGVKNLYYLKGSDLIGHDGEGTGDSIHPNDIGASRYVAEYEKALSAILKKEE